jgi:diadenylate cyclase
LTAMDNLFSVFSSLRWQDILDITINSYILFRLYVLFRGTNVLRVLVGIAFLWFFQRIAVSLGFIVTNWVFQGITAAGALIIIVVFRNEIRAVLQARNLRTILWGFAQKAGQTPIEIIVDSVYELAKKRCGALLVFPGREDLEDVVQGGTPWHGLVSKEMILSIFWRDNPVHDGAAIVEGNRITEVGVILPLSYQKDLPSYYGTRHRAASSLAEATDALVVLVSEERGNVAAAKADSLRVISKKEDLARILHEHLGTTARESGHVRRERLEIGTAALASVLLIGIVWFSFSRGLETLLTLDIPIEYVNRDPGVDILDTSVDAVSLQLSGSGPLIKSLRPEQVGVRLDLRGASVGVNTFTISSDNISLPPGVVSKKVEPSFVEVTLDVPIEKVLPIQVDWAGKLPKGVRVVEAKLVPQTVSISGGRGILGKMSTVYTEKVPVDNITESGSMTVNLALVSPSLTFAAGSQNQVNITYTVAD